MMTHSLIHSVRRSIEVMVGALIMLHLMPMVTSASAALQSPVNEVRVIDRDVINLSDVFTHLDPRLDKAIGPAPQPGRDMVLNARTLMKLAIAYGVNWQPASAADQITLRRDGTVIDADAVREALNAALKEKGVDGTFEVAFNSAINPIVLNKGARRDVSVTDLDFQPQSQSFVAVITPVSAPARQIAVAGKIERLITVPVARVTLQRDQIINPDNITLIEVKQAAITGDVLTDPESLKGLVARRTIPEGRMLKGSDVELPLDIKRGEKITLLYRSGSMELSAIGRALQDGRKGERVRVVNTTSNKEIQGTVTRTNQVVID